MTMPTEVNLLSRIEIVAWTARIGAITAEALALRECCTVASARARLGAAQRAGLLERARPLAGEPALFTATRNGLNSAELRDLEPGRLSVATARHAIVCASVAAALERLYPDQELIGERELRREESRGSIPLASASLGTRVDGAPALHRPDMVLWSGASREDARVAVEVELTVKAPRRLQTICRAWARCRRVSGVLYLVTPQVRGPLERAIAAAGADRAIAVLDLGAVIDASSAGRGGHNCDKRTIPEHP